MLAPAGTEVAAFTSLGHPLMTLKGHATSLSEADSSSYEILVDPQEIESSFSDMSLQIMGTEQGVTGLNVEALQRGGVPFEVVASALASGWQGLQDQHSKMAGVRAKVSAILKSCQESCSESCSKSSLQE